MPEIDRRIRIARAEPQRAARRFVRLAPAPAVGERQAVIALRQREIGIEAQRGFELGQRILEAPRKQMDVAERVVRPGVLAVGADRVERGALGKRHRGGQVQPAHMGGEHVARREQSQRLPVVRVDRDRLLEQRLRDHVVLPRHAPVMRQRAHHQIPGIHAVRRLALRAKAFRRVELRLDRGDDVFGDLVLHGEHVGDLAIVALRPDDGLPVATSLSCAVMRTRSPSLRTLPSTT